MSVILRTNELNCLIYKYMLQSGLSHSAFTFFNETNLADPLKEYRFDLKAGHLLTLLQKALIYMQIESHISFTQYQQCKQPIHLLRPHTCHIVQKIKKQRKDILDRLDGQITDSIRRTNSIYNTAVPNTLFKEIVYDPRNPKYLQKFPKIKFPAAESKDSSRYTLSGTQYFVVLYDSEECEVMLMGLNKITEQLQVHHIIPCIKDGELTRSYAQAVAGNKLVQLFDKNQITVIDFGDTTFRSSEFNVQIGDELREIKPNQQILALCCFCGKGRYAIVSLNTRRVLRKGQGNFWWKDHEEFLQFGPNGLLLMTLKEDQPLIRYNSDTLWEQIQFNDTRTLFAAVSYRLNLIRVYTFQQPNQLFQFQVQGHLKQIQFLTCNGVDYLCWLTGKHIKIYDLFLSSFAKSVQIQEYDPSISQLAVLRKDDNMTYLLALGKQNLVIIDVKMGKLQRIQLQAKVYHLKQLSLERVALTNQNAAYLLTNPQIDELFK